MTKIKIIRVIFGEWMPLILFAVFIGFIVILLTPIVILRALLMWVQSEDSFMEELKNAYMGL